MTTKELVDALVGSLKIIEEYKDRVSDASMEKHLRRIQQHWLHCRPLALHTEN